MACVTGDQIKSSQRLLLSLKIYETSNLIAANGESAGYISGVKYIHMQFEMHNLK